jgi:glycosyltransferase involved in cell wall biosynthesis
LKILYCHNYYQHRGGEDVSFEHDVELLRNEGHDVVTFTRDNSQWDAGKLRMAGQTLWNRETGKQVAAIIRARRPDILHCNNLFPQISTSVYAAARRASVPVVQALRNYRHLCANSYFFRDGNVCTKCLNLNASWHGLRYGCYRDSRAATSVVVAMQYMNRTFNIMKRSVDAFFTPTEFARQVHIDGGFDPNKIMVRSNFLTPDLGISNDDQNYALFIGRLSDEKGVDTIIKAWIQNRITLQIRIVGTGPAETKLRAAAAGNPHISFKGQLSTEDVLKQLSQASFLLMPSLWYETFGRTIAEAFSRGKPVIASRLGAMQEIVDDGETGYLFEPGNATELAAAVSRFGQLSESEKVRMRHAARAVFEKRFCSAASYAELLKVYDFALQTSMNCLNRESGTQNT